MELQLRTPSLERPGGVLKKHLLLYSVQQRGECRCSRGAGGGAHHVVAEAFDAVQGVARAVHHDVRGDALRVV